MDHIRPDRIRMGWCHATARKLGKTQLADGERRCTEKKIPGTRRPDDRLPSYCYRAWSHALGKYHSGGQVDRYGRPPVETWQDFLLPRVLDGLNGSVNGGGHVDLYHRAARPRWPSSKQQAVPPVSTRGFGNGRRSYQQSTA